MIKRRLDAVTIFRFVAAFYVFVFHAYVRIPLNAPAFVKQAMYNGAIGMSFFFVLSGFILTYNYDKCVGKDYYKKRILRIYPAYLFCGFLTIPFIFLNTTFGFDEVVKSFTVIILFITSTQGWFHSTFGVWNFGGTWSISVEMFFYAIFPALLGLANSDRLKMMALVSFISVSAIIPVSLIFNNQVNHVVFYSNPIYRLPEFAMGIVAAKYMQKGMNVGIVVAFIAVLMLFFASTLSDHGWMQHNYIVTPAVCLILMYLSKINLSSLASKVLRPFLYLGEISYSFYLMQLVVFMYLDEIKPSFIYKNGFTGWVMLFLLIVSMAHLSYILFEKGRFTFCCRILSGFFRKNTSVSD